MRGSCFRGLWGGDAGDPGGSTHLVSRALGGTGRYNDLLYAFGAFFAPLALVGAFEARLASYSPLLGWLGLLLLIYQLVLEVIAVRAVHGFSRGRAVVAVLLIRTAIVVLALCAIAALIFFAPQG